MKIRVWVKTCIHGSKVEDVIELDETDGPLTEEEIDKQAEEARNQMIEWNWERVED